MQIMVAGDSADLDECREKFGEGHHYSLMSSPDDPGYTDRFPDVIFDFLTHEKPAAIDHNLPGSTTVFLNTCCQSLDHIKKDGYESSGTLFGFAGMRSFLNRDILEVSLEKPDDLSRLKKTCSELGTNFQVVNDRAGMVTPRVICMIINEAWFAFQDGTASKEDIDLAMKTGTNYPFGPFEWCQKIGGVRVISVLNAMYRDTNDERYVICPLLLKEFNQ